GIIHLSRFQWIERVFGLSGLLMIVVAVSAVYLHPLSQPDSRHALLYAYFAVGIFSAMLMEYEVHFYFTGAIEEDWKPEDLGEHFMVASLGSIMDSLLTMALMVLGATLFLPRYIFPQLLSTTIVGGAFPFARTALVVALLGAMACF